MKKELEKLIPAEKAIQITGNNLHKYEERDRLFMEKQRAKAIKYWNREVQPAILKAANNGERSVCLPIPIFSGIGDIYKLASELGYISHGSLLGNFVSISW